MDDFDQEIHRAKDTLMRHYDQVQAAQSARLIGFGVALFTLIQAVQHSSLESLSNIFVIPNVVIPQWLVSIIEGLKLLFFFIITFGLLVFIIRTIFRYALFGLFSEALLYAQKKDIAKALDHACSVLAAAHETAVMNVVKSVPCRKLYGLFDANWFVRFDREGEENESLKGWVRCGILAFVLSFVVTWLLW